MLHSLFTLATFSSLLSAVSALDAWHLDEVAILANEQLDPVVNPNAQSSHMHKIIGGSGMGASYNYATYSKAKCTSLKLSVDKSNYWMPNLYIKVPSTGKYTSVPVNARFYYFLGRNSQSEPVQAFPEGLRMLTGNPMAKSKTAEAEFYCQIKGDFSDSLEADNFNFNRDCPLGMKTDTYFPPCWDGVNLYKDDNSHMAYPRGSVNANACPISHPVRLPAIMLEYTFLTSLVAPGIPLAGNTYWANGDSTGYGIHADFVNGWDRAILSKALVSPGCAIGTNEAIPITECDVFQPYFQSTQAMKDCKPDAGILAEPTGNDDMIGLTALPGCNPPWGNTPNKPTCASPAPQLDMRGLTGTDGARVAATSAQYQFPEPTTPGWQEIMCIQESKSIQGGVSYVDSKLTPQSCQASCLKEGYLYAAVGQIGSGNWNCICGSSLDPDAGNVPGSCTNACPGDSSQKCGGTYIFSVYKAGPGTTPTYSKTSDGSNIMGCYNLPDDKTKGLQASATYTFTSGSMTRDLCIQACKQFGAKWAYTKSFDTCACGSDWNYGPGSFVPDSYCPIKCNGNSGQICGDYYRAIVYDISNSNSGSTPVAKPEGMQGCYTSGNFAKNNGFFYNSDQMTTSLCRRSCRARGFGYAGLGAGQQCYCSANAPASTDLVADAICNVACSGDSKTTCGSEGTRALSIYDTTGAGAQTPSGYPVNYVGCSADGNPRTLGNYTFNSNSLTSTQCRDVCGSYGYTVYGTQYSFQCYCGVDLGPRGLLPDSVCNTGCGGNSNERCGAAYILSIYSVNQGGSPVPSASASATVSATSKSSAAASPSSTSAAAASSSKASTTSSPAASASSGADATGCYTSSTEGIAQVLITSTAMTPATCRLWCGVSGYTYSLLTAGNSCGCRNNLLTLNKVADSQCASPCSGAGKSMCGGTSAWALTASLAKSGFCARSMPRRLDEVDGI